MKDILVATINDEILKDYKFILKGYNVLGMKDVGIDVDIEETGWTFLNNAWLKAYFVNDYIYNRDKKYFDGVILGDDSSLVIDALRCFPGILCDSYKFSAEKAQENLNKYIIDELKNRPDCDRRAEMCTTIVTLQNGDDMLQFIGEIQGFITKKPIKDYNQGFESIFEVLYETDNKNYTGRYSGLTLSELPTREKNRISARKKALKKIIKCKIFD